MRLRANQSFVRGTRLCVFLTFAACSVSDGVLGSVSGHAGRIDGGIATETCALTSPLVTIQGHDTCTGRLAASRFSNALCTCGDVHLGAALTTRGFDSSQGPYQTGQSDDSGAAVGVNGNYVFPVGDTDIGGSFSVARGDLQFLGKVKSRGDFYSAGNVSVTGLTVVSRNAWFGGSFSGLGPLEVGGDLHHSDNVIALPVSVMGANLRQTVTVAQPCPCGESDLLDISALVDAAKLNNDNDTLGISRDALAAVAGDGQVTLSCGRAYLSQIAGMGNLVVYVTGMAALFIDGSIDLTGSLSFDVAPGAEIDVFVKQNLRVLGALSLASKDRPASGRIWVGGAQAISLAGPWVGNLYAPWAHVGTPVGLEVWGSIFAGDFAGGAYASFTFDRAILSAGASCKAPRPPAGVCTQCQWCSGGSACVSGSCGSCKSDSDCCSLSVCSNGACVPLVESQGA
jgi:hypothetical protein